MTRNLIAGARRSFTSLRTDNDYLGERLTMPNLGLLFLVLSIFRYLQMQYPLVIIGYFSLVLTLLFLFRPTRRMSYLLLTIVFLAIAAFMVFSISNGPQDNLSDRDDAAEIAAQSLLHGENPWAAKSVLGLPITTSPTGILLSIPSVLLTGHINLLTFLFWIAFIAILLAGDLHYRNRTFGLLIPLLLLPGLAVPHTLYWSLEELYFPLIFIAAAAWALSKSRYFIAGACAACVVFGRLNYSMPMTSLFIWMVSSREQPLIPAIRFAAGAMSASLALLLPFAITLGTTLVRCNFVTVAVQTAQGVNQKNTTFSWTGADGQITSTMAIVCLLLLVLLVLTRLTARHTRHPFWHVAAGGLMTQLTLFVPGAPNDYVLTVMGPALFAAAFTPASRQRLM